MNPRAIGFGVLSWRDRPTLTHSLQSYRAQDFVALFGEATILFQDCAAPDARAEAREFAAGYGMEAGFTTENRGILGGFRTLAQSLSSEWIALVESDALLAATRAEAADRLSRALAHLRAGRAQVYRLRHRRFPGQQFAIDKRRNYWPAREASAAAQLQAAFLRSLRPDKARRAAGWTVYYRCDAAERFPDLVARAADGDYFVSARSMEWSNNTFLIERRFFLDVLLPAAERRFSGRGVNGMPTIEVELNSRFWRRSGWRVGVGEGLFEHFRPDHEALHGPRQSPA